MISKEITSTILDDAREKIAREIKTWCDADFRYQGYNVGIAKPIEPLADQIIPLVRADVQGEIEDLEPYIRQVVDCDKFKDGDALVDPVVLTVLAYYWEQFKSGTFKGDK